MREIIGNIWDFENQPNALIVVPTNGYVNARGACVMGRGVALDAAKKYPVLPYDLGTCIKYSGNKVYRLSGYGIITFPVKHTWKEMADLALIESSAQQLAEMRLPQKKYAVFMPRVGCGNGNRRWEEVKPILDTWLTGEYTIVSLS